MRELRVRQAQKKRGKQRRGGGRGRENVKEVKRVEEREAYAEGERDNKRGLVA